MYNKYGIWFDEIEEITMLFDEENNFVKLEDEKLSEKYSDDLVNWEIPTWEKFDIKGIYSIFDDIKFSDLENKDFREGLKLLNLKKDDFIFNCESYQYGQKMYYFTYEFKTFDVYTNEIYNNILDFVISEINEDEVIESKGYWLLTEEVEDKKNV